LLVEDFDAAHARHVQVEKDHVATSVFGFGQRFFAIGGFDHRDALPREAARQRLSQLLVVVHDQQAKRRGGNGHVK